MKITAFARKEQGTGASRRLRRAGQQNSTPGSVANLKPLLPQVQIFQRLKRPGGAQNRDMDHQLGDFGGFHSTKTRILEGRLPSHMEDVLIKRVKGDQRPNAAPQTTRPRL